MRARVARSTGPGSFLGVPVAPSPADMMGICCDHHLMALMDRAWVLDKLEPWPEMDEPRTIPCPRHGWRAFAPLPPPPPPPESPREAAFVDPRASFVDLGASVAPGETTRFGGVFVRKRKAGEEGWRRICPLPCDPETPLREEETPRPRRVHWKVPEAFRAPERRTRRPPKRLSF